jgi:hypothetical protein
MKECPTCSHPPIRHVQDGTGWTCIVCEFEVRERLNDRIRVCTTAQVFKLTQTEREQATRGAKDSYPPRTVCAQCSYTWESHLGFLCPNGDDTFLPLLDTGFLITH